MLPDMSDIHHLSRVLRLRPGEKVVASDGRRWLEAVQLHGAAPWLEPLGEHPQRCRVRSRR